MPLCITFREYINTSVHYDTIVIQVIASRTASFYLILLKIHFITSDCITVTLSEKSTYINYLVTTFF